MSGALRLFFWDDWTGAPAPTPAPTPPPPGEPGAGGGKGRGKGPKGKRGLLAVEPYEPVPNEYWAAREDYLRSLYPEEIPPAPPPEDLSGPSEANRLFEERARQLEQLNADRSAAVIALRSSETIQEMKQQGSRIAEINTKIAELMGKQAVTRFMH